MTGAPFGDCRDSCGGSRSPWKLEGVRHSRVAGYMAIGRCRIAVLLGTRIAVLPDTHLTGWIRSGLNDVGERDWSESPRTGLKKPHLPTLRAPGLPASEHYRRYRSSVRWFAWLDRRTVKRREVGTESARVVVPLPETERGEVEYSGLRCQMRDVPDVA